MISVGPSVSLAANGSVAPLALDPPAIRRTLEVLAAEQPDVLHLHEPLVPGPALTALLAGNVPGGGHVPRLRPGPRLRLAPAGGAGRRPAHRPADGRLPRGPRAGRALARRRLPGAAQRRGGRALRQGRPLAGAGTPGGTGRSILFVGRHEPRKGLEVLLEAFSANSTRDARAVGGRRGPGHRARSPAGAPAGVEWLGRISDQELAAATAGGDRVLRPVPPRRVASGSSSSKPWPPAPRSSRPTSPATATWPVRKGRRCSSPAGDPAALAGGLRRVLDDADAGRPPRRGRHGPGRQLLDGASGRPLRRPLRDPPRQNAVAPGQIRAVACRR